MVTTVLTPVLARGVLVRRPGAVRLLAAADADRRAVDLLQRIRRRYGSGPLRLRLGVRRAVLVLDPAHVHRVLAETPDPFSPATREKIAALEHFQPHGVLISTGAERADRRRFNEDVLDARHAVHRDARGVVDAVQDEMDGLLTSVHQDGGVLTWDAFAVAWWRMVRRVVLGSGARDDEALTDDLRALRAQANWAFLHPKDRATRERFESRLREHLRRAEPGSLAASVAAVPSTATTDPDHQVPQWLFAFDAAGMATFRALALLAAHPGPGERARAEADEADAAAGRPDAHPSPLPYLRACLLESVRLWPTTPVILRETTSRTRWPGGPVPEGTLVVLYAPFFHRDDESLPLADRFDPAPWLEPRTEADWPLVPFSAGPAECAGRNLALHVTSTALARLVARATVEPADDASSLDPARLPGTLDPFTLRFRVR